MGSSQSRSRHPSDRRRVRHTNSAPPTSRLPRRVGSVRTPPPRMSPRQSHRELGSLYNTPRSPKQGALNYRRYSSVPESSTVPASALPQRSPRVLPATPTGTPRNRRPEQPPFPKLLIRRDTFGNPPDRIVGGAKFRAYEH